VARALPARAAPSWARRRAVEQQGAFRLLKNEDVSATVVQRAAIESTARACEKARLIERRWWPAASRARAWVAP